MSPSTIKPLYSTRSLSLPSNFSTFLPPSKFKTPPSKSQNTRTQQRHIVLPHSRSNHCEIAHRLASAYHSSRTHVIYTRLNHCLFKGSSNSYNWRILAKYEVESTTPMSTYGKLLKLLQNTDCMDSFDLYCRMFLFTNNAIEQFENFSMAFEYIKKDILGPLHKFIETPQLFGNANEM